MSELLDCPFCGCKATFVKHSAGVPGTQGFDTWNAVACKHCRATVGACDRRFRCREDAAAAWNRRLPNSNSPEFDGIRSAAPAAGTVEKDAERLESAAEALRRAKRELDIIQARQAGSSAHVDAANHYQHAIVKLIDAAIEAHNARSPSCGT